jgi:ABC-2 type transport system ATP-binding protein
MSEDHTNGAGGADGNGSGADGNGSGADGNGSGADGNGSGADRQGPGEGNGEPADTGPPLLSLRGVEKTYDGIVALDGVDLDVHGGEFHCLVGPNGSGKSTLLRIVLGLIRPTAGEVDLPEGGVGCGFQEGNFYRGLTVAENLDVFAALMGADDAAWREEVVRTLRLNRVENRVAGDLSGGYGKKLDLALAMLDRPDVLFLDEPFGDLDDVSKERLLEFLADYSTAGNAVVVSTHHLVDFEPLVDRLTILHDGDVVVDAPSSTIDLGDHDSLQAFYVDRILELERAADATTDGDDPTASLETDPAPGDGD